MKRKEARKLLRQHPDFAEWVRRDESRRAAFRASRSNAANLFKQWSESQHPSIALEAISRKTKRASEVLNNVQSLMEMMSEYTKKMT